MIPWSRLVSILFRPVTLRDGCHCGRVHPAEATNPDARIVGVSHPKEIDNWEHMPMTAKNTDLEEPSSHHQLRIQRETCVRKESGEDEIDVALNRGAGLPVIGARRGHGAKPLGSVSVTCAFPAKASMPVQRP